MADKLLVIPRPGLTITTTQRFDRKVLTDLIAHSDKLPSNSRADTLAKLRSLKSHLKKGSIEGKQEITYKHSNKKAGQIGFGRLYGSVSSLETFQSEVRATLCGKFYHDIDFVNCQPAILLQFAQKCGFETPYLQFYVENRTVFIKAIMDEYNVTRDEVKDAILSVLFAGRPKFKDNEELEQLSKEIRDFTGKLITSHQYDALWNFAKKEDNKYGSFLSFLLQTIEKDNMLALRSQLESRGWSPDVLVYDGIMVARRDGMSFTRELLDELTAAVKEETGYELKLSEKAMVGFDMPAMIAEDDDDYAKMKKKFEKVHFHYKPTNTVVIIGEKELEHHTIESALSVLNTWILPTKKESGKHELFIRKWLADPERRLISELVFKYPEECGPTEASLFRGFGYVHLAAKGVEPMEDAVPHFENILSNVCGDETAVADHVRKLCAHILQYPFDGSSICTIFSSEKQGTGKDTFVGIIARVVGVAHTAHYEDDAVYWSPYDTKKEGALLSYLEEAGAGANKAKSNALKARITSTTTTVNPKGLRAYCVANMARTFMTTNETCPVKMEETDRRFFLITPSTRLSKQLKPADWTVLQEIIKRPSFTVAIGEYLSKIDLTDFNPRDFPTTELRAEIKELCAPNEVRFLREWNTNTKMSGAMKPATLYKCFQEWCRENGLEHPLSQRSFLTEIARQKEYYTRRVRDGYNLYCRTNVPAEVSRTVELGGDVVEPAEDDAE